jgi:hypothetical protein
MRHTPAYRSETLSGRALRDPADEPSLDPVHQSQWEAIRSLFPNHAMADQPEAGLLLVTWTIRGRRRALHYAAPVMLKIDSGLLLALWASDEEERAQIAGAQRDTVEAALANYDPASRVVTMPMIVLGEQLLA